jgi:uncharacterized repeat protein (TIGR03803 family)
MTSKLLIVACFFVSSTILNAQDHLWGITREGGSSGVGVIFKTNADGTGYTVVKDFEVQYPGEYPWYTQLTEANNEKLYGMTSRGGANNVGVIFEFDPVSGLYSKKLDFETVATGSSPYGNLTNGSNGKLYGLTSIGGTGGYGVLFAFDPVTGIFEKKVDVNFDDGILPQGHLIETADGKFYGLMKYGAIRNEGTLFEYDPVTNLITKKIDFNSSENGVTPEGSLTLASNGKLYGFSRSGQIYEFDPANGDFSVKRQITSGYLPYGAMVEAGNGKLYGTTYTGGAFSDVLNEVGYGTLFEFDPQSNDFEIKVNFGYYQTGANPYGSLIVGDNGKLYGTTTIGGLGGPDQDQAGVLFEYEINGDVSLLHSFQLESGAIPYGGVTQHTNGKFYGMTTFGGIDGTGVLYEFNPATSAYTKKLDFGFAPEGATPSNKLTLASNGNLYGVTSRGGNFGGGVIFEIDTLTGSFTKRYEFSFPDAGISAPDGGLTEAGNGKLYGVARATDNNDPGAVFEFDPAVGGINQFRFATSGDQGNGPMGGLLLATNGKLYGTTVIANINNLDGTLFEFNPLTGSITKKADFERTTKGAYPTGNLIEVDGKLYGTTLEGGANNQGVMYEYSLSTGQLNKQLDFDEFSSPDFDLGAPGSLVLANNGKIYGLTSNNDGIDVGAIYEYSLATNTITRTLELNSATGNYPLSNGLSLSIANNKLYGTTSYGGEYNRGILFELDPDTFSFSKKYDFNNVQGGAPTGSLLYVPAAVILAVEKPTAESLIQAYPNPSIEYISLTGIKSEEVIKQSQLVDFTGRSYPVDVVTKNGVYGFSVSHLQDGQYILQVITRRGTYRVKFIKY